MPNRYVNKTCASSVPFIEDRIAQHYVNRYLPKDGKAVQTTGDGNCLFNAASIVLCGDEGMSLELKYKCCLELVLNADSIQSHKDKAAIQNLSPDYEEAILKCAKSGGYSSMWTMIALSHVTQRNIENLYPMVNGLKDPAVLTFNTMLLPSTGTIEDKPLRILWTRTSPFNEKSKKSWTPNHFVPLVEDSMASVTTNKTSTPSNRKPSLFVPRHSKSTQEGDQWRNRKEDPSPYHQFVLWLRM